jgi:hypothetical protein
LAQICWEEAASGTVQQSWEGARGEAGWAAPNSARSRFTIKKFFFFFKYALSWQNGQESLALLSRWLASHQQSWQNGQASLALLSHWPLLKVLEVKFVKIPKVVGA